MSLSDYTQDAPRPVAAPINPAEGLETWLNAAAGRSWLQKLDGIYGGTKTFEIVGGQRFTISPAERRMNEEAVLDPADNPFRNGDYRPIRLLEGEWDTVELRSSPNVMGDEEMTALLEGEGADLIERLGQVTSTVTLERMVALAEQRDVRISRLRALEARIAEVASANVTAAVAATTTAPALPQPQGRVTQASAPDADTPPMAANPLADGPQGAPSIYDDGFFADGIQTGETGE